MAHKVKEISNKPYGKNSKQFHQYWGKLDGNGEHIHPYVRHSVEKDVLSFCGWDNLENLFQRLDWRNSVMRDVGIIAFKMAGRINEILPLDNTKTVFDVQPKYIAVINFYILKRYDKILNREKKPIYHITCGRCGTENDMYEVACTKCNANLIHGGKKHFKTKPRIDTRQPFFIPRDEPFDKEFVRIITERKGLLFPSDDERRMGKPFSYGWAYHHITKIKLAENEMAWWNHRLRGERLMQLRERGFDSGELKNFSAILSDKTLEHYTKGIMTYANNKLNIGITPNELAEYGRKANLLKEATSKRFTQ